MSPSQTFHLISYLQYPLMLAAVGFYVPFVISLLNQATDWGHLNQALILFGVALSLSTLQDTRTTQNEFSRKIWSHPTKGKAMLVLIAVVAFGFVVAGLLTLLLFQADHAESIGVGITVLGIGLIGVLKAATEMFENHRVDKQ